MTRAFLLSLLVRQRLSLKDDFAARYPHHWLVWEPGAWIAPDQSLEETMSSTGRTAPTGRPAGDSLCYELVPRPEPITVGRAPDSAITINDATLSRQHARLHWSGTGWILEAVTAHSTKVSGASLAGGLRRDLLSEAALELGGIRLTYYDPAGFVARLIKEWD